MNNVGGYYLAMFRAVQGGLCVMILALVSIAGGAITRRRQMCV